MVATLSGLAGVAHVLVSIILGGVIITIGLQFRSAIQSAQDTIVGWVLIATGIGFVIFELTGHSHDHEHDHGSHLPSERDRDRAEHAENHPQRRPRPGRIQGLAAIMVPFGAAASPDLTILPVFLAAATVGVATAIGSLVVFAAVTIGTIVGLTLAAARGGYQIQGQWLERWGNMFTAFVLAVVGLLVLTGTI